MTRRSFLGWLGIGSISIPLLNKLPMIEDTHHVVQVPQNTNFTVTLPRGENGAVLTNNGEGFLFWNKEPYDGET
jgi:hypothetical protein